MKKTALLLAGAMAALAHPVQATILLNEIHLRTPLTIDDNTPGDRNFEFIELKSTTGTAEPCSDLWILLIENDGGRVGEVKEAWPLRNPDGTAMTTGANGLLLLGEDYTKPNSPYQFVRDPRTTMGDPAGMGSDDLPDTRGLSVLLVRGYTNPEPLPGAEDNVDIDMDDDGTGVFDWADPTPPSVRYATSLWTEIVDSAGYNGDNGGVIKRAFSPANLSRTSSARGVPQAGSTANFFPHSMARSGANNTANSRTAWYGGTITGTPGDSVTYGENHFNLLPGAVWKGLATAGQPNFSSAPVAPVFRINEINLNPPGTPGRSPDAGHPSFPSANDGKFEYVEIINTVANQAGGGDYSGSLAGCALLVVDSSGTSPGKILEAWDLNTLATGRNGLLLLGDDYPDGYSPFTALIDPGTQLGDPDDAYDLGRMKYSKLSMGDLVDNGVTFLLVQNFSGFVDDDVDINNDGLMDSLPASNLIDSVNVPEVNATSELVPNRGGYSSAKPDIVVAGKHYNADNLSRIPGNSAQSATASWSAGVFGSSSPDALTYRNGFSFVGSGNAFRGAASPGQPNYSSASPPVAGTFRINEIHIDPPTDPDWPEYVEVISVEPHALMYDLWLIILDASPTGSGIVKKIFDLRGQATGGNRLAIFADGIEEDIIPLVPFLSGRTSRDDPSSNNADGTTNFGGEFNFTPDSISPNNGVSVLLVSYSPATPAGVPAIPGSDLDANNDGTMDAAPPWVLKDGISTGNGIGGGAVLPSLGFSLGNVSRYAGNMEANSAAAWFGGQLTGVTATSFEYGNNHFGAFKGAASPARHNVTATPNDSVSLLLNEININPAGADNNKEFVELRSANDSAMSTNGYSVLLIDNDDAGTGRVLEVWDLDGAATGTNGLLLMGSGYDTNMPWTGGATPEAATIVFAPDTMDYDDFGRKTDNLAMTVLLVKNFTGRAGDDLDNGTQTHLTAPDDHIFNLPLSWSALTDSAAMRGFQAPDNGFPIYSLKGFIFPGTADLTVPIPPFPPNGYTPDTVARFAGSLTPNDKSAWYGANLVGTAATSTVYDPAQYFPFTLVGGKVTPGQMNITMQSDSSDPDNDGVVHLMEAALGMNSLIPDNYKLPQPAVTTQSSVLQPAFSITRPSGGVPGVSYTVEASLNLQVWKVPVSLFSTTANSPGPGFETQHFIVHPQFLPQLAADHRVYFRLKVQRQ